MPSFTGDTDPALVKEVTADYHKAAFWLPFSALEIKGLFDDQQLKELDQFIKEVKAAGDDNDKKTKTIEKFSPVALKLMKLAKIIA